MAYSTPNEVGDRMGFPSPSPELAARLTTAITAADAVIDQVTGRTFEQSDAEARTFRVPSRGPLWCGDIRSIDTLKFDQDDDGVFEVTVPATEYELDSFHDVVRESWPWEMVRLHGRSWPIGNRLRLVEITGDWGWGSVPQPINYASSMLAARYAQRSQQALYGNQVFGELGTATIQSQDPDVRALLAPYVRMGIG